MTQNLREICLIHANCLGDPLVRLLMASPGFTRRYRIYQAVNYTQEPIADELIRACGLFLYQHLSAKWEQTASERLLSLLPASARAIRLPVPVFRGYWPFWTGLYPMQFGDAFLERLAEQGLSAREMLLLYLKRDALDKYDLESPAAESLAILRAAEADGALPSADFIERWWKRIPVFTTINHPALPLLHHITDRLLASLALPPLSLEARALAVSCDEGGPTRFELPIHPQVASRLKLAFGHAEQSYHVYGTRMSFARYVACYIDCRLLGHTNFVHYLLQFGEEAAKNHPAGTASHGI